MERKTALAAAAAITMSVVSGVFAFGAISGTSSSSTPSPAVQTATATPAASPTVEAAASPTTSQGSHESHEQERASATTEARGEFDD